VRSVSWWTKPDDTSAITKHEDYDWITLVTCRGYDEKSDSYKYRTVVRAVLVSVEAE
jgi:sortase (surface protein transpeptidase)